MSCNDDLLPTTECSEERKGQLTFVQNAEQFVQERRHLLRVLLIRYRFTQFANLGYEGGFLFV